VKFLVTAGPTREPIDPVRFLSNRSSGKMGYAIARVAAARRHEVILISGPVCLPAPDGVELVRVLTTDEMFDAIQARISGADAPDVFVMAAAVADFKPARISPSKIKKSDGLARIELAPTRDILSTLIFPQKKILVVGFAAETESLAANALKKLAKKKCDLIIGNDVSRMDTGFESDDNEVLLCFRGGEIKKFAREKKVLLAQKLVRIFERMKDKR
jgi:phosphopantothenoylcysteine synthetase/decarboxylase